MKFVQDLETRLIPNNIRNQTAELKMADCQWCLKATKSWNCGSTVAAFHYQPAITAHKITAGQRSLTAGKLRLTGKIF